MFVIGMIAAIWFVAALGVVLLDRIAVGMTGECTYRGLEYVCRYDPLAPFYPNIVIIATVITIGVVWLLSRKGT
jgi:hypothetical protein